MKLRDMILVWVLALVCPSAWGNVFVHWTSSAVPPAKELGLNYLVLSWNDGVLPQVKAARRQGYRVYVEAPLDQAAAAAETGTSDVEGVIVTVRQPERSQLETSLSQLRSAHPNIKFVVLSPDGKRPVMRGSMVIKRGAVLEVSSPTAQPWIDTNLALVKTEQRFLPGQVPLYTFSWRDISDSSQQPPTLTAADYSLAVAEAGTFHADLLLELDERLQKGLGEHDARAWKLWNEVRSYVDFYSHPEPGMEAAANVAIVVDDLDPTDEVMNLLARHNLPFKILRAPDLKSSGLEDFDVVVVFAKPDKDACEQIAELATQGKIVVVVEAHGPYPWHSHDAIRVNEHTVAYPLGKGKVLELSEPVTDPETFAQDIRRLLEKQNALISLWNGLTTIAVPYREHGGTVKVLEFVNYAEDEPLRVQVQVKGSFPSIRYETPERRCCESLVPITHNGFTEFVLPELRTAGRVYLDANQANDPRERGASPH